MAIHSSILAWKTPRTEGVGQATVHGVTRVGDDIVGYCPQGRKVLDMS